VVNYYIPIGGTWSWRDLTAAASPQWYQLGSIHAQCMRECGGEIYAPADAYNWTTSLGGMIWQKQRLRDWQVSGRNLEQYVRLKQIPLSARNLIVHSHAWQVLLFALYYGLEVQNVVAVSSPLRLDVIRAVGVADEIRLRRATPPLLDRVRGKILYIGDPGHEYIRDMGNLFDGHFGIVRSLEHPKVTVQLVAGHKHSRSLTDPEYVGYWKSRGWADVLLHSTNPEK
jgi:hypothetical protein